MRIVALDERTQKERIKKWLNENGSITPLEALREFGCMRLAARINELIKEGNRITSVMVKDKNRYGDTVRYAKYIKEA